MEIYNNTKHSTTGFSPNFIFNSTDENLFAKIKNNTIKSQIYCKSKNNILIENKKALLAENFLLIGNKIKKKLLAVKEDIVYL